MTTNVRASVSQILRNKDEGGDDEEEPKKKSREDWRKAKELEEARKAGTAPAAVDETGKDINPHIPQYISSAPWYYGTAGPTLKHQRPQADREGQFTKLDTYYNKGVDTTKVATKFRKGACENCGALTHKKKDCLERPRKIGAKFTNAAIAPDEFNQPNLNLSYDGKRDRWNGYDPEQHKAIIEEYQKVEEAKRELRAKKLEQDPTATEGDDKEEEDEDKYVDEVDMPGTKVDSKQRITVRNLRIREDTAKYLRNLDPNSAYYDPKTRSMRDNPNPSATECEYAGENFVRFTGDTRAHGAAQLFAWEAHARGLDVHLLAEPTKLQLLQRQYDERKQLLKTQVKESVLERYGGAEHLQAPPRELLLAQSEVFTRYNRDGTLVQGPEKQLAKSQYEEDVLVNNHTTVWGSYWRDGRWGYKCCHSFIKMSYCVGEAGKSVVLDVAPHNNNNLTDNKDKEKCENSSSESSASSSSSSESENDTRSKTEKTSKKKKNKKKAKKKKKKDQKKEKKAVDKLKKALEEEERNQKRAEHLLSVDERKRPYNSMYEVKAPTDDQMEAYLMKRKREEDPMSQFL
ncbi:PREDICTED: pre-mRNA-splicing factor Slu7 [Papilio xuthus]|uniref:Pre-mRNA-splicing factor SLU7 n=1 Tax=Papilio xuthus TaxID=66420 RepID=A0A194QI16_PAPXU|nr:PREDICTED: pre-mRNA-splicing factor Slu7 [Papilio xuthus]KPJ05152.1 Pre-mRNA-splicing factor SLU7 [Papilio xuthus]